MKVAYLLYPRFPALDVVGTFQVLAAAPGLQSVFVVAHAGAVVDDTGSCPLQATAALADVVSADVVVVPGSDCSCDPDLAQVRWLRAVHRTRPSNTTRNPPLDAGSPAKAPVEIGELVSSYYVQRCS